ncbi:Double-stranded RNA-binding protein [Actinidia chinensis var. chinensis]|uniref:Double-stranded RNA-binding protein n=1 Tax=Actinidia chinensis var. chinensis TaxID=1590841 RepID=A0A2R6PA40_ACTCC|nr:Double-stranded RNA-binding protein [Actinidia chinensis var. chinensis]
MYEQGTESQEPQPETSEPVKEHGVHQPNNPAEHVWHKNRLQEYTQRSGIPFPEYRTINEGAQHAPAFRSTVFVDGAYYTTPITFSNRKAAEQEAARVAWYGVKQKIKDEGYSLICKDTTFCKSILNEYAVKLKQEKPTYATIQSGELFPVFLSSLVYNGVSYAGEAGRNKKEAEQLAARAVILSILGNSDSETVIFEIIKSKFRLYAALYQHKDTNDTQNGFMPLAVNTGTSVGFPPRTGNVATTAILETCSDQLSIIPAAQQPFHEFKKPRLVPSYEIITTPIVFVPPVLEQPLGVGQSSVRKRNRKNKKVKKKAQVDAQYQVSMVL